MVDYMTHTRNLPCVSLYYISICYATWHCDHNEAKGETMSNKKIGGLVFYWIIVFSILLILVTNLIMRPSWLYGSVIGFLIVSFMSYGFSQHKEYRRVKKQQRIAKIELSYLLNHFITHNNIFLIGICGKARAGKSTVRQLITDLFQTDPDFYNYSVGRLSMIQPLRDMTALFFSEAAALGRVDREKADNTWGISPRRFMQLMGTEIFKGLLGANVWIKMALKHIAETNYDIYISEDIRAENEVALMNSSGLVIRVVRPGDESIVSDHVSEKPITQDDIAYTIVNDGSLQDLYNNTHVVYNQIKEDILNTLEVRPSIVPRPNAYRDNMLPECGSIVFPISTMN